MEDDPILRSSFRRSLGQLGYHIFEAPSGDHALEVWAENRDQIRLLVTDLAMPGDVNGKELGQNLTQQCPELKVIYMSGTSAQFISRDFVLKEGVNFLSKPIPGPVLLQTVRARLNS